MWFPLNGEVGELIWSGNFVNKGKNDVYRPSYVTVVYFDEK